MSRIDWRSVLSRAPLPMLALAASHGVYSYNLLFVPTWVALVSAAAFELTYCGLSVVTLTADQQPRARRIAASAVIVSVIYNTLAGLFHRRPDLMANLPLGLDLMLAILHGLPLAIVAYSVAQLLLHDVSNTSKAVHTRQAIRPIPPWEAGNTREADQNNTPIEPEGASQPIVAGSITHHPPWVAYDVASTYAAPDALQERGKVLLHHTSMSDPALSQPIAAGSTPLNHSCPRCGSPISQAQYAAAVRRGATWRGCARCRSVQPDD